MTVPVLVLSAAACSGGGDEGGGGKQGDGKEQQSGGGSGDSSGGGSQDENGEGGGGGVPPLDEKQLTAALLKTGDVKGYRVQRSKKDALAPENTIESDDAKCSPISDAVDSKPKHARSAYTSGTLLREELSSGGAIQQVLLSAYGEGEAEQWLGELKKALRECDSLEGTVGTGQEARLRIEPGEAAGVGDDSVRFTMRDAKRKDAPTVVTVVRTGGNTATYLSISLSGKAVPVAKPVVEKQHEKLAAAAKD